MCLRPRWYPSALPAAAFGDPPGALRGSCGACPAGGCPAGGLACGPLASGGLAGRLELLELRAPLNTEIAALTKGGGLLLRRVS